MTNFYKSKRYNNHYNLHRGIEASTSLYSLIQQRDLTSCLEVLESLGFAEERALHVISSVQLIAGLEVGA